MLVKFNEKYIPACWRSLTITLGSGIITYESSIEDCGPISTHIGKVHVIIKCFCISTSSEKEETLLIYTETAKVLPSISGFNEI